MLIIGGFAGFTFSEFIHARREARQKKVQEVVANVSRENALVNSAVSADSECCSDDEGSPLLRAGKARRRWLWKYLI